MRSEYHETYVLGLLTVAALLIFFGGSCLWESKVCMDAAQKMEMHMTWNVTTGCMVEHKPGKWIPLGQYRVME